YAWRAAADESARSWDLFPARAGSASQPANALPLPVQRTPALLQELRRPAARARKKFLRRVRAVQELNLIFPQPHWQYRPQPSAEVVHPAPVRPRSGTRLDNAA